MSMEARFLNALRGRVRATLRSTLSQERRTELKRLQGVTRKRLAPLLSLAYGSFRSDDLAEELTRRLPADYEVLMVHSSFDTLLPMYKEGARELLAMLIKICGPERTLVMPAWVMGGRNFDTKAYFSERPFDVRRTPSELGMLAELFRRTPGVLRSLHPTCSVCALGPLAQELTSGHHLTRTALGPGSPFGTMTRRRTAILGIGVEFFRCLTHAHTAREELGEAFPVKFPSLSIAMTLVDYDGSKIDYELVLRDKTKSAPKLDLRLLWSLLSKDELREWRFHGVPMFVIPQARVVTERLMEAARKGITIYGRASANSFPPADVKGPTEELN